MISPEGYLAAVFDGPSEPFRLERFPVPRLASGEVLVRVTCCTVCGSDLHTYRGRRTAPYPSILGHEVTGVVEEIAGDGSSGVRDLRGEPLRYGDRITWCLVVSCGQCRLCRAGLPQKCETLFKYGHERCDHGTKPSGGLSQYCVLRKGTAILRVPECLPDVVAATANCAGATVAAVLRIAGSLTDADVLVQGAGMLGLMAAAMARDAGASKVVVVDPDAARSRQALAFGATHQFHGSLDDGELQGELRSICQNRGFDVAMEFSGNPAAVEGALPLLGAGARYVVAGAVFPSRPAAVDMESIVRRMIHLSGVHNYTPPDLASALSFLTRTIGTYRFENLVGGSFPLDAVNEAFAFAERMRPARVAVLPELPGSLPGSRDSE